MALGVLSDLLRSYLQEKTNTFHFYVLTHIRWEGAAAPRWDTAAAPGHQLVDLGKLLNVRLIELERITKVDHALVALGVGLRAGLELAALGLLQST